MDTRNRLNVYTEIGKLKTVMLHRPGREIENLIPDVLERLLFDDIPDLQIARDEHDAFAKTLQNQGVEVVYLEELCAQSLTTNEVKKNFVQEFISEADIQGETNKEILSDFFLNQSDNLNMIMSMMAGVTKREINHGDSNHLSDLVSSDNPYLIDPMPNLYFTRDPFAVIGSGVSIHRMRNLTRQRETLFAKYIFNHHPIYGSNIPKWYDRTDQSSLEGGDILVLSPKVLAIGISQRTDAKSIEDIATRLFDANESFEQILAFHIPNKRAFMHLDTVFTMLDRDKFTIHPEIEGPLAVYSLTKTQSGEIQITKSEEELEIILAKALEVDSVTLIRCGGDDPIAGAREQWNDGANTLAIAPGEVVVYSRNHVTNELLDKHGVKLHIIPSSELSRGRGGPRCMSMPFWREGL